MYEQDKENLQFALLHVNFNVHDFLYRTLIAYEVNFLKCLLYMLMCKP